MEDNVKIYIRGVQNAMTDDDVVELVTTGCYQLKNDKVYLTYVDNLIDEQSPTKTVIKGNEKEISILRYGDYNSHLLFEKDTSHLIPYETPLGLLDVVNHTKLIDLQRHDGGFRLDIQYELEINQVDMGLNNFYVEASPLRKKRK